MTELLAYYKLCPITSDILGIAEDADKNAIICTLGKKIVYILQLDCQKQLRSWSTSDNFSSKVVYDNDRNQYVGVFSKMFIRFWDADTEDINQIKKVKLSKPVHEITNVFINRLKKTLVVYEDGSCESLDYALQSRSEDKSIRQKKNEVLKIENVQVSNGFFSYIKTIDQEKIFCFSKIDEETLKPFDKPKTVKLVRVGQNVKLMGCVVAAGKTESSNPFLVTIWSDNRLFRNTLSADDNLPSIGTLHSIVDTINANKELSLTPISEDCIAIYAGKHDDDGSFVVLYNMKYKIVQSQVPFKVYLSNFKLSKIRRNIFLAMGEQLSVIPFRISIDQLSSLVGSQCNSSVQTLVEKEMINEDLDFEENIEFDEDQTEIEDMEFRPPFNPNIRRQAPLSKAKTVVGAEEIVNQLNEIYREEIVVDVRLGQQLTDTIEHQLVSNIDEVFPVLSENFELFCSQLENYGHSEVEITDRVIPLLVKTNRTQDIGLLLKKYNHVSEKMLTKVLKYLLSCDSSSEVKFASYESVDNDEMELETIQSTKEKVRNVNLFLSTNQDERRDVLVSVLSCSFDASTISKFLRREITLGEMIKLADEIYKMLTTSFLDEPFDVRGNLVEGDDFDMDAKLFEWFQLLLDSHYQQILLSHDGELHRKLELWMKLVDDHIRILTEMSSMRPLLIKLSNNKPIQLSKKCNQWYSIESLQLY